MFELRSKRLSEKMWTTVSFLQNNNLSLLFVSNDGLHELEDRAVALSVTL